MKKAVEKKKKKGIGLALSGGGYRAALFHLGGLWRLNELGLLRKIKEITSVSGGSILAAYLGLNWKNLNFQEDIAGNFKALIIDPIRKFCSISIDIECGILGILSPLHHPSELLTRKYRELLYGDAKLSDLPYDSEGPRFTFYATSLQTGVSVRFAKPYMADYRLGMIMNPDLDIATVVAASSAFPSPFCPVKLQLDPSLWENREGADLHDNEKLKSLMLLGDGGIYDNMGLERIWDTYETVMASDAGRRLKLITDSFFVRVSQLGRALRSYHISYQQNQSIRRRFLIELANNNPSQVAVYWSIATKIEEYEDENGVFTPPLMNDTDETRALKQVRTRLNKFNDSEQKALINWGYALADSAIRMYMPEYKKTTGKLPY